MVYMLRESFTRPYLLVLLACHCGSSASGASALDSSAANPGAGDASGESSSADSMGSPEGGSSGDSTTSPAPDSASVGSIVPCGDAGCAAPDYCFVLSCAAGAPPPDAASCATPPPVCASLPADCADGGSTYVHSCPGSAGSYYCNVSGGLGGVDRVQRRVECGAQ